LGTIRFRARFGSLSGGSLTGCRPDSPACR